MKFETSAREAYKIKFYGPELNIEEYFLGNENFAVQYRKLKFISPRLVRDIFGELIVAPKQNIIN